MYSVVVRSIEQRKQQIEQKRKASESSRNIHPFYEFQNRRHDLPIIQLEFGAPVYRMQNYRTRTAQLKYARDHGKASDFFSSGQENESSQQVQHELLVAFAKDGRAGSIVPIYDSLRSEEQREPLIITAGGVVVNGNRRLAAMRELLTESPADFRRFSHVDCAVLPTSVTVDEIREIEVRLQMRSETRLPYGWVNESLAVQELLESRKSIAHIADLMSQPKQYVKNADGALREADLYLKEWEHAPGEYQKVEDGAQFFSDFAKGIQHKQGDELEISRRIGWTLFSAQDIKGRRYSYNFGFGKRTDEVVASLVERLEVDLFVRSEHVGDDDDIDIEIDDDIGEKSLDPLIEIFDDPSNRDTVTEEVVAICENMDERARQGKIGRRALEALQNANKNLQGVDLSKAEPQTYSAIDTQLDSILVRATELKEKLQPYKSGQTK